MSSLTPQFRINEPLQYAAKSAQRIEDTPVRRKTAKRTVHLSHPQVRSRITFESSSNSSLQWNQPKGPVPFHSSKRSGMSIDSHSYCSSPSMEYPSMGYLGSAFYPKWKTSPRRGGSPAGYQLLDLYPRMHPMKPQPTPAFQERPLSYPKYPPCYPYCGTVMRTHPTAFHPQKTAKKPVAAAPFEPAERPYLSLNYQDRRICTCNLSLLPPSSSPFLEKLHKREDGHGVADHQGSLKDPTSPCYPSLYRWFLPNRRYSPDDVPYGLRLSSLTTHTAATMLSPDDEKRPPPKRFRCTHCEKSFGKSSHLRDHIRTHTGDRPYRCQYCDKAFTQYSNLRTHTRIHTGEKPYRCRQCNKSFTQAVTLRSHTRTHNGDKSYHCKPQGTKPFTCFTGHMNVRDTVDEVTRSIKKEDTTDDARSVNQLL